MLGALALVFALLIGALWIYRHWQQLLLQRTPVTGLRVVDVKSLGQRLSVYVVAYRHQQFLIGGSPNGLLLLSPLDADPSVSGSSSSSDPGPPAVNLSANLSANLSVNPASEGSFQSVLEKASTPSA
jgi:flagellar biogenesis protein FliO